MTLDLCLPCNVSNACYKRECSTNFGGIVGVYGSSGVHRGERERKDGTEAGSQTESGKIKERNNMYLAKKAVPLLEITILAYIFTYLHIHTGGGGVLTPYL